MPIFKNSNKSCLESGTGVTNVNWKNLFKAITLIFCAVFLFFGFTAKASASTYYVDGNIVQNFCAGGNGTYILAARTCGGSGGPIAFKTVGAAIINSSQGDIIYVRAGTYAEIKTSLTPAIGTGTGLTITPYNNEAVIIDPASYANYLWQVNSSTTNIIFDGGPNRTLTFNNSLATMAPFFHIPNGNVTITRAVITDPAARVSDGWIHLDQGYAGGTLTLSRNLIHDMGGILIFDGAGSGAFTINVTANQMDTVKQILGAYGTGATLNEVNNTVVRATSTLHTVGENLAVNSVNNIFVLKTNGASNQLVSISAGKTPRSWNFKNNILWRESITNYTDYSYLFTGQFTNSLLDKSNKFVNPNFTAYGTGYADANLTLQNIAANFATGRGLNSGLPSGGDYTETAWPTNDNSVGCYINPTLSPKAYPVPTASKVAFVGDSIMYGANGSDAAHTAWGQFGTISGLTTVNGLNGVNDLAAISGQSIQGASFMVDRTIFEAAPGTAFVSIGINDLGGSPALVDNADRVLGVKVVFDKLIDAGITPIWLGVESKIGNPPDNTVPLDFNSQVLTTCNTYGMSCGAILSQMMVNANWKTDYYSDLVTNVHPNDAGHLLIARLAEYLYYPKFTISTDKIDPTGNIKIYNDGKYRYTTATSSTMSADLSIAPTGGFNSNDKSELMAASSISWSNIGSHHKSWTESSTDGALTNTVHTIGDLEANRYYNVSVDGSVGNNVTGGSCVAGLCQANSSGQVVFTYTGHYSSHTFDVSGIYTLTYTAGANGTLSGTTPQTVNYNASGTAVTAVPNTGYHFVSWSDSVSTASRTDASVTNDITVTATFAIDTHTLTYTAGANGTLSGTTPQTVNYNASGAQVTATPNAHYHFTSWSDGVLTAARTDTNVQANITVSASFAIDTYTLTYSANANGSITGTTPQTVNYGASGTEVVAVPDAGYHFVEWTEDNSIADHRTDTNVTADHTYTATFAITRGSGGGGGSVIVYTPSITIRTPGSGAVYNAGSSVGFDWTPANGAFTKYKVSYSTDNGTNWTTIIENATSTNLSWIIPNASTVQGRIRVEGYNSSGTLLVSAISTGNFTINGTIPAVNPTPTNPTTNPATPPPATDATAIGAYSPAIALANTPDIATDKNLTAPPANTTVYCTATTLIKGSLPAVYYCGADGKRYVFVNSLVYFTWYGDFSTVKIISDVDLAKIPLGGNITYRPGVKMVKAQTDPKVYTVSRGGLLRWISSEAIARQLYGEAWNKMIDYIPDAFWTNYKFGASIN